MTFTNLSFETGNSTPTPPAGGGTAATGWSVAYVSTGSAYANFGDATVTEAAERFERNWSTNEAFLFDFSSLGSLSVATFNPAGPYASTFEGFEALWSSNESALSDLARQEQLNFGTTFLEAEGFEREWSTNENFMFSFLDSDLTPAPAGAEDFETHWHSNESFITAFVPGNLTALAFDGTSPTLYEDFEQVDFNLWYIYVGSSFTAGDMVVTIENAVAKLTLVGSETPSVVRNQLIQQINNLGQHYIAGPAVDQLQIVISLDPRLVNDPNLDLAQLLDGGGAVKVDSPGGSELRLQRVDATTLWTQSGKLFSI